jgi:hypothetical protein
MRRSPHFVIYGSKEQGWRMGGGRGGSCPPRFWRIRRRRRAGAARRITTCPTGFLTLAAPLKSNHEMHGSWISRTVFSVKPENGSKKVLKATIWAFFSWNFDFFSPIQIAFSTPHGHWISYNCHVIKKS